MDVTLVDRKLNSLGLTLGAWAVVLLVSNLPNAIWQALIGAPPAWLFWVKIGLLLALVASSIWWNPLRVIRNFFLLLMVLMLALYGMDALRSAAAYHQWENQVGWIWGMVAFQALKLIVAGILIVALLLLGRRRADFFLTRGDLAAPVRTTKVGDNPGKPSMSWGQLGLILGICILPLTLVFFAIGNLPSSEALVKALPFFPLAVIFALTNAFSEEMQFRASFLEDLRFTLGEDHAIWMTATFFGFAHYFSGPPAGILGVLITGLLGALFARCMLGSKGIAVPWFIHFCQNVVVYAFMAIGSVA